MNGNTIVAVPNLVKIAKLTKEERKEVNAQYKSDMKSLKGLKGRGMKNLSGIGGYIGAGAIGSKLGQVTGIPILGLASAIGGAYGASRAYINNSDSDYAIARRLVEKKRKERINKAIQ